MKGSVKARGKEILTTAPRRSKNLVGGTAIYAGGRYMGSARAQSLGLDMARQGVKAGRGRVGATRAMSKGLKRSRNAQAKKEYFRATGKSQARRNAAKLAGVVAIGAAGLYVAKTEKVYVNASVRNNIAGVTVATKRGAFNGSLAKKGNRVHYDGLMTSRKNGTTRSGVGFVQFSKKGVKRTHYNV